MIVTNKNFFMEKWLVERLEHLKKAVNKKWDAVILIDGIEGSGKSTLASTIAYYLNPNYSVENIVFTPKQFIEAVESAKVGDVIHWDEFALAGMSADAITKIQKTIVKKTVTIRKKRLYIILVIPFIFQLKDYFCVRSRFLLHTYTPDGVTRGYMKYYNYDAKKILYFKGRKLWNYSVCNYNKRGTFRNVEGLFFNEDDYQKKKDEAIKSIDFENDKEHKWKLQRDKLIFDSGKSTSYICKLLDLNQTTVDRIKKAIRQDVKNQ